MPRTKLNPRSLRSLLPRAGRLQDYWWDSTQGAPSGFGVRVSASGEGEPTRTYVVAYRTRDGRKRFYRLGAVNSVALADAREHARDTLQAVSRGEDPQGQKEELRQADDLVTFLETFIDKARTKRGHEKSDATKRLYRQILNARIRGTGLGRTPPAMVTRDTVEPLLERIAGEAPVMANRTYQLLKAAFEWGARERRLASNLIREMPEPRPEAETPGDRVLKPGEIKVLWDSLDERERDGRNAPRIVPEVVAAATRIMLLLGTRSGETLRARWQDLDLAGRIWRIPGELRKGGEPLTVPLSTEAVRVFQALKPKGEGPVFAGARGAAIASNPGRIGAALQRAYKAGSKRAKQKAEPWTFHDLRRTCATGCGELGAPPHVVALILGHKTMPGWGNVTAVYDRAQRARDVAPWLQRWARRVEAIVASEAHAGADVVPLGRA